VSFSAQTTTELHATIIKEKIWFIIIFLDSLESIETKLKSIQTKMESTTNTIIIQLWSLRTSKKDSTKSGWGRKFNFFCCQIRKEYQHRDPVEPRQWGQRTTPIPQRKHQLDHGLSFWLSPKHYRQTRAS
jgi:hypothetical protein